MNQFSFGRIADQLIPIEFFAESAVHARARTKQIAILNPSKRSYFCQKKNPSALFFREKSGRSLPLSFKSLGGGPKVEHRAAPHAQPPQMPVPVAGQTFQTGL